MTDNATENLKSSGWTMVEAPGFISLIGPLWQRVVDDAHEYALVAQDKHHNRRGLVQGGLLMTFADRTSGMTARYVSGRSTLATVQMTPTLSIAPKSARFCCRSRAWSALPAA